MITWNTDTIRVAGKIVDSATGRGYEAALARIEQLMDAVPNTPEGDELELLTALVESYEEKRFPIDLPDPIEAIRFRMEQMESLTG